MKQPLPVHVGQRNVKTALSASLCALIYYFLGRNPAFACIGAIFGMGADMEHSRLHGGNRLFGTVIGGFLGILVYRIYLIFTTIFVVPVEADFRYIAGHIIKS